MIHFFKPFPAPRNRDSVPSLPQEEPPTPGNLWGFPDLNSRSAFRGRGRASWWVKERQKEASHVEPVSGGLPVSLGGLSRVASSAVSSALLTLLSIVLLSPPFNLSSVSVCLRIDYPFLLAKNTRLFPSVPRGRTYSQASITCPWLTQAAFLFVMKELLVRTPDPELHSRKIWRKHQHPASHPSPQAIAECVSLTSLYTWLCSCPIL